VINDHGKRRARDASIVLGEALSEANAYLQDTLAEPGLVAVDSSVARGRLLLSNDVVALGLDVANTAGATNTIEKLLLHQLALVHKLALEEAAQARKERDPALEIKRLQTSARLMNTFQHGMLTLQRLRTGGTQRVVVQYVHLESGAQAVRQSSEYRPEPLRGHSNSGTTCSRLAARFMLALAQSIRRIDRLSSDPLPTFAVMETGRTSSGSVSVRVRGELNSVGPTPPRRVRFGGRWRS
jgi:hypothetical protein